MSADAGARIPIIFGGNNYKVVTAARGEDDVGDVDDDTIIDSHVQAAIVLGEVCLFYIYAAAHRNIMWVVVLFCQAQSKHQLALFLTCSYKLLMGNVL